MSLPEGCKVGEDMRIECIHDRRRDECPECDKERAEEERLRRIIRQELISIMAWSPTGACRFCGTFSHQEYCPTKRRGHDEGPGK